VANYADNYFEYDSNRMVTKEIAQGGGCSCGGAYGQGTSTYTRTTNTDSGYADQL
jgi:hypothetical protein